MNNRFSILQLSMVHIVGNFDAEILDDSYAPTIAYLVYFGYILQVIVMLNLLIVLMGGSYESEGRKVAAFVCATGPLLGHKQMRSACPCTHETMCKLPRSLPFGSIPPCSSSVSPPHVG
jgi:hypothetical protein